MAVSGWEILGRIQDRHVRSGLRVGYAVSYAGLSLILVGIVGYLLVMAVLTLLALAFALWVLGFILKSVVAGGGSQTAPAETAPEPEDELSTEGLLLMVGRPGTNLYSASGNDYRGRIDRDGVIYTPGILGGTRIGCIGTDGSICRGRGFSERLVGRIDGQGNIYRNGFPGGSLIGRIDGEGCVRGLDLASTVISRCQEP